MRKFKLQKLISITKINFQYSYEHFYNSSMIVGSDTILIHNEQINPNTLMIFQKSETEFWLKYFNKKYRRMQIFLNSKNEGLECLRLWEKMGITIRISDSYTKQTEEIPTFEESQISQDIEVCRDIAPNTTTIDDPLDLSLDISEPVLSNEPPKSPKIIEKKRINDVPMYLFSDGQNSVWKEYSSGWSLEEQSKALEFEQNLDETPIEILINSPADENADLVKKNSNRNEPTINLPLVMDTETVSDSVLLHYLQENNPAWEKWLFDYLDANSDYWISKIQRLLSEN